MPRKGPKPSSKQMALHLIANSQVDFMIDTSLPGEVLPALQELSDHLDGQLKLIYSHEDARRRFERLDNVTKQLLASAQKAKELYYTDPPAYAKQVEDVIAKVEGFEKEMLSFARSNDINTQIFYFAERPRVEIYNLFETEDDFLLTEEQMKMYDPLSVAQPQRQQPQVQSVIEPQNSIEEEPRNSIEEEPQNSIREEPKNSIEEEQKDSIEDEEEDSSEDEEDEPEEEEQQGPEENVQQEEEPRQPSSLMERAATYVMQANDDEYGPELEKLERFLDGIDQELVRISEIRGSEQYAQDLQKLSDRGQKFLKDVIEARRAYERSKNSGETRKALDVVTESLDAFERQYQDHVDVYAGDVERISGMADYHDVKELIDVRDGRKMVAGAGFTELKTFFSWDVPPEEIIGAIVGGFGDAPVADTRFRNTLAEFDTSLMMALDDNPDYTLTGRNASVMHGAGSDLFYACANIHSLLIDGKTDLARKAIPKAVQHLKDFETLYAQYQRYDPENLQKFTGTIPEQIAGASYEGGKKILEVIGPAQLPASSGRGIPYEQMAASLSTGEWENGIFKPVGELKALNDLIEGIENNARGLDNRFGVEKSASLSLQGEARNLLQACLLLSQEKNEKNLAAAAEACAKFDHAYQCYQAINADFASKYTAEFDKTWKESSFESGKDLLNEIRSPKMEEKQEEPQTEPEKQETEQIKPEIPKEPAIKFTGSGINSVQIAADFVMSEKKRKALKEFEEELDERVELLQKAGADADMIDELRKLSFEVTTFRENVAIARREHRKTIGIDEEILALSTAANDAEDLEENLRSFNQKYPGVLGEKGRSFAWMWQLDAFQDGEQVLPSIGYKKSAYDHIQEIKPKLAGKSEEDVKQALTNIIVLRELSAGEDGKTGNLKKKRLSTMELEAARRQKMKDPMFSRFLDSIPLQTAAKMAGKSSGSSYEAAYKQFKEYAGFNKRFVLPQDLEGNKITSSDPDLAEKEEYIEPAGRSKSAAKWIEDAQKAIKNSHSTDDVSYQIARIIAARQLAEAERGKRENIDKHQLADNQIDARARELLKDKEGRDTVFSRFLTTMRSGPVGLVEEKHHRYLKKSMDVILDGHGGKLEDELRLFCHSIPDGDKINHRLYQRYMPVGYKNYSDYLMKHENPRYALPGREDVRDDRMRLTHAQKRMTSYILAGQTSNTAFDQSRFNEEYQATGKSPMLKIMTMTPARCQVLNAGNYDSMTDSFKEVMTDFSRTLENGQLDRKEVRQTQKAVYKIYHKLTKGKEGEDLDKFLSGCSAEYRHMVRTAENYAKKRIPPDATEAMAVFSSVLDYQKGKEKRGSSAAERSFNESMELAKAVVQGSKAEKYLQDQVDYVNKKRGIDPQVSNHRDRITVEKIDSALDKVKAEEAAKEQKKNENGKQIQA